MSQFNWAGYPWTEIVRASELLRIDVTSVPANWGRVQVADLQAIYVPAPIYVQFEATRGGRTTYFPLIALDTFPTVVPLPVLPNGVTLTYRVRARDPGWAVSVEEVDGLIQ